MTPPYSGPPMVGTRKLCNCAKAWEVNVWVEVDERFATW